MADRTPGPISMLICGAAALATFAVSIVFLPAAELIPAQVFPEKRVSGESCVRIPELMQQYAGFGVQILQMLPAPVAQEGAEAAKVDPMKAWQEKLIADNGEKYGQDLQKNIEQTLGGDQNLKTVLNLLSVDKNFVYNAYALFLGLALFVAAIAIQAMGRWGAEEKTILPAKK